MHPLLRYTLDLFGPPAGAPAIAAADPAPQADAPPHFAHPQASRTLQLDGVRVAFSLERGKRRTIGMVVGPEGLSVRAPRWTPLREIDAALQEKARWIVRKLHETTERRQQQLERQIVWAEGACFPYLGHTVCVHLVGKGGVTHLGEAQASSPRPLHLALPQTATPVQIRAAVRAWLMQEARAIFVQRLDHFAPLLQVRWTQLALSNAATRWGSARSDGSIRLNWRLVHCELAVLDYVVAHELSHLRVMNHSPRFWDTVRSVVPDYAVLRARLKDDQHLPRW